MNKKTRGVLRTVTDRFNLSNDGRKLGANKRNYIIQSVKDMISNENTKELLRLKEAVGYYGHKPRERANKLFIGESEIVNINGNSVVVDNVPASRTTDISVDEKTGVVTHTQEILDTPSGKIINALIEAGQGGWSWATGGRDTQQASYAKTFAGFDYVLQPNYLSLDHPSMLMESVGDRESAMFESLSRIGIDEESARKVLKIGNDTQFNIEQHAELEQQTYFLEGLVSDLQSKASSKDLLLSTIEQSLPVFLSSKEKLALKNMASDDDIKTVKNLFESIAQSKLHTLPKSSDSEKHVKELVKHNNMVNFSQSKSFR